MRDEPYGTLEDGREVRRIVLARPGMEVAILTYGGIVERILVPDRDGRMGNVTLGLPRLADYVARSPYFGAIIGRYANRIAGGRFTLDGRTHQLSRNEGANTLHGGREGFDKRIWQVAAAEAHRLELRLGSPDGDEGFPGALHVRVTYALEEPGTLRIGYAAEAAAPTVLNLTNHAYWNLAGGGSVLGHELQLEADHFLPVDAALIPTGEQRPVAGTPFDFRTAAPLGARIGEQDAQLGIGGGYDHCFVLRGGVAPAPRPVARLRDPASGRVMEVLTDQPGLQLYSGNRLDGTLAGPDGGRHGPNGAVALETQHFPDSPNRPDFPPTVLRPGEVFRSETVLRFGVDGLPVAGTGP